MITFLGTGTSQGVPIIGCNCDVCLSDDTKDRRLRSSVIIEVDDYHILIDIGPDFRQQMLAHHIKKLDAILITHEHNDHIIGMDDIRPFNFSQKIDMPIFGLGRVLREIKHKFKYIFEDAPYPGAPRVICHEIFENQTFDLFNGLSVTALGIQHGNLPILGYRIKDFAYITDASYISDTARNELKNLDVLVINALQFRKHNTHFNFDEAIEMAEMIGAKKTYLTHMSHELGKHDALVQKCPDGVLPAYDGMTLKIN